MYRVIERQKILFILKIRDVKLETTLLKFSKDISNLNKKKKTFYS